MKTATDAMRALLPVTLLFSQGTWALIPATPGEQTRRAITSTRETISQIRSSSNLPPRIYIDYLIPLPPATTDADIDPWPGGLAQMYPYAEEIVRDILTGVVEDSTREKCSSQVIGVDDCCGLFVQESPISPDLDVAAVLFPGPDQYAKLKEIEDMVGSQRTLIVFNRQFTRPEDFGFFGKKEAKVFMDKYQWGFAFQEIACRGEDVKLTFEQSLGWQACMVDEKGKEIELEDSSWDKKARPEYEALTNKINEVMPEPLWMRMMQEASEKGLKFQRKE
mmetsp:Transcript_28991/g.61733  ORF Transcript_28991/g.61733 Transcript_28991/m.61733 type:complete len:278 (+) Transcript_28991:52-885(+)|eukprot:CAMPEP_0172297142 /NCGR_PEP_ID=MMETSP1058-20130122/276_1 /TAXON_ID=83371 /ORGANISM="Detonula confervacea, Strain CCMP 353" /LENGTH=277 /DNA_ID=CAMNT_0013006257 /DNA_START=26 /DNA_END=859 /DNA_ORIENTATION=+